MPVLSVHGDAQLHDRPATVAAGCRETERRYWRRCGRATGGAVDVAQAAAGRKGGAPHPEALGGGVQDALVGLVQQQPVHRLDVHPGVLQRRRHHLRPALLRMHLTGHDSPFHRLTGLQRAQAKSARRPKP